MRGHPSHMHFPAAKVDEKQDVVRHEPAQRLDLSREKIRRHEHIHVCADTLRPGGRGLTLWSWGEAMTFQDVPHGLVTDGVPKVGQGAGDPVVAPGAILHSPNAKEIFCQVESHV